MALRLRFQYPTGSTLGLSIERLTDGLFLDFADGAFRANPSTLIASLPEDAGAFLGRWKLTLPVPGWLDGDYCLTIHDLALGTVAAEAYSTLHNGDDATVFPPTSFTFGPVTLSAQVVAPVPPAGFRLPLLGLMPGPSLAVQGMF